MIHTRVQVDPTALVSLRDGEGGREVVVLDADGEASLVVSLSLAQCFQLRDHLRFVQDWD